MNYRGSALSEGRAGGVRGGDRLPWVQPDAASDRAFDNFTPLTSLDWQVHVYGDAGAGLAEACRKTGLALHTFAWSSAAGGPAWARCRLLVRPDGYVGLADPEGGLAGLADYLRTRDLRPSQAAAPERVS